MDDSQKNANTTAANATQNLSSTVAREGSVNGTAAGIPGPESAGISNAAKNNETTNDTDITTQMAEKIIKEQEGIIGPVAYEQATKVQGISIDQTSHHVSLQGDKKIILENLVKQYEQLFGKISIAICKEAVRGVIANVPADQVPQILL